MALQNFRAVTLMVYTETFLIAGSSIPLMVGLFGFKVSRLSFWLGLFTAGITYSLSKYNLPDFEYIHSLFTIIASIAVFFVGHYILNHGFAFDVKIPRRKEIKFKIPKFKNIEKSLTQINKGFKTYILLLVFCYINFLYGLFLFAAKADNIHNSILSIIFFSVFFCTILLIKDLFSLEWQKEYLTKFWLFALCYCIPFVSTTMLISTNGEIYSVVLLTLGLLLLSYVVD